MQKAVRGKYTITQNKEISPGIFEIRFDAPDICGAAAGGQFVNVYLPGGSMLLPRPLGIAGSDGGLTLVYAVVGAGTEALSLIEEGERIELMGPLGEGVFDYIGNTAKEILLIGGGLGIPPLLFAAQKMKEERGDVNLTAFLGYRSDPFYVQEFKSVCGEVHVASETEGAAGFCGNVIDLLDSAGAKGELALDCGPRPMLALACGPRPMLAAAAGWCAERDIPLRVSLEERMGCGYGACAGCTVETRFLGDEKRPQNGPYFPDGNGITRKKVCVHGPVFWADEVVW